MAINNRFESKSSAEQRTSKRGDDHVENASYRQSRQAHRDAVYRDTHREVDREVYREVGRQAYQVDQVDQDSTEAALRERICEVDRMVTEADFQRRLPSTDDCWLQYIIYRACGSTAQSSDSASALELGKYSHLREAYVLDIDE